MLQYFTALQLRFDFLVETTSGSYAANGLSGLQPITLRRSYLSFYDLDTGEARFEDSKTQIEAIQIGPQVTATEVSLNPKSELDRDNQYLLMQRLAETGGRNEPAISVSLGHVDSSLGVCVGGNGAGEGRIVQ